MARRHWGFTHVRGLSYWAAQNLPMSTAEVVPGTGRFDPVFQNGLKIDFDAFTAEREVVCVIDARGPVNDAGKPDDPLADHIPGALTVPFSNILNPETGLFLDKAEVEAALNRLAPDRTSKPMIAPCGSG